MIKINRHNFRLAPKEDRAILLVCIGIALIFWLLVKLSQTYKAQKPVYFNIQPPEGKVLAKLPPDNTQIEMEGTGWDLLFDFFSNRELQLTYDMTGLERLNVSRGQLRTDIKQLLYSDDIKILEVNQDALSLSVENQDSKRVPIKLRAKLSFAPEHQLNTPIELSPDSVTITGPHSVIKNFTHWTTDSITLSGLNQTRLVAVDLRPSPQELNLSVEQTQATIEVEPVTEKSVYVPLVVKNAPDSLRIFPDKVTLTFKIGLSKYDSVSYRDFTAEIDMTGVSASSSSNTVPIVISAQPNYVKSLYYRPKSAKYFIIEAAETEE